MIQTGDAFIQFLKFLLSALNLYSLAGLNLKTTQNKDL